MKRLTLRLGLSLMVIIGLYGRVAAQEMRTGAPEVFVVPFVPYEPDRHPFTPPAIYVPPPIPPAKHFVKRVENHFDLGCKADSWSIVGNFHTEMRWLFGSSRSFFGESCVPNQPCADRKAQRYP